MRIPNIDPVERYVYTTRQAIKALQVSPHTFYKYARRLGFKGAIKSGSNIKWYTYDQLGMIFQAMVQAHMKRGTLKDQLL